MYVLNHVVFEAENIWRLFSLAVLGWNIVMSLVFGKRVLVP